VAYWNLYGAYVTLYSREAALRQSYEAWKTNRAQLESGRATNKEVYQALGQYEQFRGDRLQALGQVLENERILRALLGLPVEDGPRLIPIDTPTLAPYRPDWNTALSEALSLRPELVIVRQEVKFRQLNLIREKNNLLPDLRFTSRYEIQGLGSRLDGNGSFPS